MLETNSLMVMEKADLPLEHWKMACTKILDKHVSVKERAGLEPWMTEEIKELHNKQRYCRQNEKYPELNLYVKLLCTEAK